VRAGRQVQPRSATQYLDITESHCVSRNVTILGFGEVTRVRAAGQITGHLAQALAVLEPAPHTGSPKDRKPPRAGRDVAWEQPP